MRKINLACGKRYHRDWVNVDFNSTDEEVKRINLLEGIPYPDRTFDVAYSSHFLEHLSVNQARNFLSEVKRILKRGGILRLVVPDLENICREYIKLIDNNAERYKRKWIYVELIDQMVRTTPGGMMRQIYDTVKTENKEDLANYILKRTGVDLLNASGNSRNTKNFLEKITLKKIKHKFLEIRVWAAKHLLPKSIRDELFIETNIGERHKWMYDQYSLKNLLAKAGFREIEKKGYDESEIPGFNSYRLDIKKDGSPRKGTSSLYMECKK